MTVAPFTLFAFSLFSPRFAANLVAPGAAEVHAGGGINAFLPMVAVGAGAGAGDAVDFAGQYETHAGVVHVLTLGSRLRLGDRWAVGLAASDGFYALEESGGLRFARFPWGNGTSLLPSIARSWTTAKGTHVGASLAANVQLVGLHEEFGTIERRWDPSLRDARAEISAEWGGAFLVFRAVVPIEAEIGVIGYLPMIAAGYTWGLP